MAATTTPSKITDYFPPSPKSSQEEDTDKQKQDTDDGMYF